MTARNFVLVHGGWHGGWCWTRVVDRLTAVGHRVFAPSLTGLSDRSHLLSPHVSLTTHITDIANLIASEELRQVVLVGHSYGGFVISGVAERVESALDQLVFVDAFVPDDGQCAYDFAPQLEPYEVAGIDGVSTQVVAAVPAEFFGVNEADRSWVDRQCTPHPFACMTERIALTGARERVAHKVYVRASNFAVPPPAPHDAHLAYARRTPGWEAYELAAGHDVMVDAPHELSDLLVGLVAH